MKKILTFLLALALCLALRAPAGAAADSGVCGDGVRWTLDGAGTLTVSGNGRMTDFAADVSDYSQVRNIDAPWYAQRRSIERIVIEPGVTAVGDYAFFETGNVVSVSLPAGLTSIGEAAFAYCASRYGAKLDLPESLTTIKASAFFESGFQDVVIPGAVKHFGNFVFQQSGVKNVTIPEGITEIPVWTFRVTSLDDVYIPESVTAIRKGAFMYSNVDNIYYSGTKAQWKQIVIEEDNGDIDRAAIHFGDGKPDYNYDLRISKVTSGNRYVDGSPYTFEGEYLFDTGLGYHAVFTNNKKAAALDHYLALAAVPQAVAPKAYDVAQINFFHVEVPAGGSKNYYFNSDYTRLSTGDYRLCILDFDDEAELLAFAKTVWGEDLHYSTFSREPGEVRLSEGAQYYPLHIQNTAENVAYLNSLGIKTY